MRKFLVLTFLLSLGAIVFLNSCVKKVPEKIIWLESFDQGVKLAQGQGKNLLTDFEKEG
ncbi:MAG: hypothetical protein WBD28_09595 [Candidatus Zixiibacteriota bacterium]